jgi:hypothetical protein
MDSNHRSLGVSQESLPLDHGIGMHRIEAEAVGLEPTSEIHSPPVFKTGPSSSRLTSNSCGGRIRTCGLVVQSNGFLPAETTPHHEEGRAGLAPAQWCLTGTCSAAELPTRIKSALRVSHPPCPAAVAGIEPAPGRLTVDFPYQHRTHRITSVSVAGLEPTISCSQGTRIAKLSHTLK